MTEQEGPGGRPLAGSGRQPVWLQILQGAVLTVAAMWIGYGAFRRVGVRDPTPYLLALLLTLFVIRFIQAAVTGDWSLSHDDKSSFSPFTDRRVHLPEGWTTEQLVDLVLEAVRRHVPSEEIVSQLVAAGFSEADTHVAIARTLGGVVRARARDPRQAPSRWKDPIAWTSYRLALRDPALAAALDPLTPPAGDRP